MYFVINLYIYYKFIYTLQHKTFIFTITARISKDLLQIIFRLTFILRRGKKLREVKYLHDEKKYSELASILQDTFKFAKQQNKLIANKEVVIERTEQLSMLLNSLWHLKQYEVRSVTDNYTLNILSNTNNFPFLEFCRIVTSGQKLVWTRHGTII